MKECPAKGPRGVDVENRESLVTPPRPKLQPDLSDFAPYRVAGCRSRQPCPPGIGSIVIEGGMR